MNIEIEVPTNHSDRFIVSFDPADQFPEEGSFFLGWKRFKGIGEFKYDWVFQYGTREDIESVRDALNLALSMSGKEEDK